MMTTDILILVALGLIALTTVSYQARRMFGLLGKVLTLTSTTHDAVNSRMDEFVRRMDETFAAKLKSVEAAFELRLRALEQTVVDKVLEAHAQGVIVGAAKERDRTDAKANEA